MHTIDLPVIDVCEGAELRASLFAPLLMAFMALSVSKSGRYVLYPLPSLKAWNVSDGVVNPVALSKLLLPKFLENLLGNFHPEQRAYIFNLVCDH